MTTRRSTLNPQSTQSWMSLRAPRVLRLTSSLACLTLSLGTSADAQMTTRRATNLAALVAHPGFYHGRQIVIVGKVALDPRGQLKVSDDDGSVHLVFKGNAPDGLDEVRGEFWDIGRMKADDIRLNAYDLRATFNVDPEAPWPRPGEVTAIIASAVAPAALPSRRPSARSSSTRRAISIRR